MKCKECNSCLRVLRLDYETYSMAYWYCYLCRTAFPIRGEREAVTDKEILNSLKELYEKLHGKSL